MDAPVTINESSFVCKENFADTRTFVGKNASAHVTEMNGTANPMPTIYFITPTYPRREQFAELIRLGQTLMHVPNLHWIVADDTDACDQHLDAYLNRFGEYCNILVCALFKRHFIMREKSKGCTKLLLLFMFV